jgi:hypothetical protein
MLRMSDWSKQADKVSDVFKRAGIETAKISEATLKGQHEIKRKIANLPWSHCAKTLVNRVGGSLQECFRPYGKCRTKEQLLISGRVWCLASAVCVMQKQEVKP